jgi:hypothetical protein
VFQEESPIFWEKFIRWNGMSITRNTYMWH